MPEVRNYIVRQTREVEVRANDVTSAVLIADRAFSEGQSLQGKLKEEIEGHWGDTTSRVREVELAANEERYGHG